MVVPDIWGVVVKIEVYDAVYVLFKSENMLLM